MAITQNEADAIEEKFLDAGHAVECDPVSICGCDRR